MKKERVVWIDTTKVFMMFLVILGHTNMSKNVVKWIYSFHMPIFFILSGAAYGISQKRKHMKYYQYIAHRAKGLLLPYFTLSFLMLPIWYISFKILGTSEYTILMKIKGIFISNSVIVSSPVNATWFFTTLFLVTIVYFFIERFYNYNIWKVSLVISFISVIGFYFSATYGRNFSFPWHMNVVPIGLLFFGFGVWFISYYKSILEFMGKNKNLYAIGFLIIGSVAATINKRISLHVNAYRNVGLFLISSFFISIGIILLFMYIPQNKVVQYLASCSMIIIAVHCPILRFLEQFSDITKQFTISHPILTAIFLYVTSIIIASIIKFCFPFLIGEKYPARRKSKNF